MYFTEKKSFGTMCGCFSMEKFSDKLIIEEFENALKDSGVKLFGKVTIISITKLTKKEFDEAKEYESNKL